MPEEQEFISSLLSEFNTKLRDIEEKQRMSKEKMLLIGKNLIESKQSSEKDITALKIGFEELKEDMKRIKLTLLRLVEELDNRARKSDLEMLQKQAKMFQPIL